MRDRRSCATLPSDPMAKKTPARFNGEIDLITRRMVATADAKGAEDIAVLDMSEFFLIGERFVIGTAKSRVHLKAIADEVRKVLRRETGSRVYVEGYESPGWILCECGGVVCHLFLREVREFYALERLWGDAPRIKTDKYLTPSAE